MAKADRAERSKGLFSSLFSTVQRVRFQSSQSRLRRAAEAGLEPLENRLLLSGNPFWSVKAVNGRLSGTGLTGGANLVQDNSSLPVDPYTGASAGFVQVQSDSEANALLAGITAHVVVGTKTYNLNYNGDNTNSQFFTIADAAPATPDHLNFNLLLNDPSRSLNVSAAVQARPEITSATGFDVNNSDLAANNISLPLLTSQTFWAVVDPRTGYAKVDLTGELSVPLKKGEVTWTASAPTGDDIALGSTDNHLTSMGTFASGTLFQLDSGVGDQAIYFKPGATDASNVLTLKLGFDMNHHGALSGPGTEVVYSATVKTVDLLSTGINVSVGGSQVSTTATDLNTTPLQIPAGSGKIQLTINAVSPGQRSEVLYEVDDANTGVSLASGNFSTSPINVSLPSGTDNVVVHTGVRMGSDSLTNPSQGVDLYRYGVDSLFVTPPTGAVEGVEWNGNAGSPAGQVATFSSDPAATKDDFKATIIWGDGTTDVGTIDGSGGSFTVSGTHTYGEEGNYPEFEVNISPTGGSAISGAGSASVDDAPISATGVDGDAVVNVEDFYTVATIRDGNPSGIESDFSLSTIDWGDGSAPTDASISANDDGTFNVGGWHTYGSTGSFDVSVDAEDNGGSSDHSDSTLTVRPIAPVNSLSATFPTAYEGQAFSGSVGTFTSDPGAVASQFTAEIDWNDGAARSTGEITEQDGTFTISGNHTYAEEGSGAITVYVTPKSGETVSAQASGPILDSPLQLTSYDFNAVAGQNTGDFVIATLTDANPNAPLSDLSATIDWGDRNTSNAKLEPLGGGSFNVVGSHEYEMANFFTFVIDAVDVGGATIETNGAATVTAPSTTQASPTMDLDLTGNQKLGDPADGVANYLPGDEIAGKNGLSQTQVQKIYVVATGLAPGDVVAFSLSNTSKYDGISSNATSNVFPSGPNDDDFVLNYANSQLIADGTGTAWIELDCRDFGGHTTVNAIDVTNPFTIIPSLNVPLDTDGDGLPDKWEQQYSVTPTRKNGFDSTKAMTDGKTPDGIRDDDTNGDGKDGKILGDDLTALDEYRGFMVDDGGTEHHIRTDPIVKDVFVNDATGYHTTDGNGDTLSLVSMLDLNVHQVTAAQIGNNNAIDGFGTGGKKNQRAIVVENVALTQGAWGITDPGPNTTPTAYKSVKVDIASVQRTVQVVRVINVPNNPLPVVLYDGTQDLDYGTNWRANGKAKIGNNVVSYKQGVPPPNIRWWTNRSFQ